MYLLFCFAGGAVLEIALIVVEMRL